MARWTPGTTERLQEAALALFTAQGFERTTAEEIARAAGVTERTFFRHFADKREVLFLGQDTFEQAFLDGLAATPPDTPPMEGVARAVRAGAARFEESRRDWSRARQVVIDAHPSLQERERHKLAGLARALATALRDRGTRPVAATLAAEAATTVFVVAFSAWIRPDETRSLPEVVDEVLAEHAALSRDG